MKKHFLIMAFLGFLTSCSLNPTCFEKNCFQTHIEKTACGGCIKDRCYQPCQSCTSNEPACTACWTCLKHDAACGAEPN